MSDRDIAVVGMAARFPGAPSVDAFWHNLRNGVESIIALSDDELRAAGVRDSALADPDYVKVCPVLEGVGDFDPAFFGLSPRDAEVMDPAHRLFLEVAWEAMEHAGRTGLPDEDTVGVFAASGAPYYLMDHVRPNVRLMRSMGEFLVRHTNNDMNFLSTRVSYEMDLRGPSVNIQTACSSALVAVHMACESLRAGDCTVALAGGSTVLIPDRHGYQYHEGEILSPDGHCRPFDADSAGTVFGSGSGCVVLKRLSAALDDGDTIHAVIKGSAINNDGAMRVGFLAPGVEGQAAVVGHALDSANVAAEDITYIETHGTGTSVGDPIEVAALSHAFASRTTKRQFCAIGSVKSNIGHLGEAAGSASLIKAIMALKHREIPASLGFKEPNPQIDFADSPFWVNDRLRPWTSNGPRRCGVTALGAGGTNCHVILEEAPAPIEGEGARAAQLLTLSASSATALEGARSRLADALEEHPELDLADAAYTLAVGRRAMSHRYTLVVSDRNDAVAQLRAQAAKGSIASNDEPSRRVVFMFPGGGAQYPGMAAELYESEPVFRDAVDACLAIANERLGRDLKAVMFADEALRSSVARELEQPTLALPALFASEYALASLFRSWGVEPSAMLGHSMGEYVAACLANVMSLEDALQMVMLRGRLFERTERGAMLSVPLSEAALRQVLSPSLSIAAVNAPELCVASGPVVAIEALAEQLAARDIECTRIRIDVAAHSALLDPVLGEFRQYCRTIALKPPTMPFLSNVSGDWITAAQSTDPEYWVTHLRSTVRFADCLSTLRRDYEPVLLEVGPGRTLSSLARAQAVPARFAYNAIRHPDETTGDLQFALGTLGKLWASGAPVEWPAFYDGQLRNRVPLPTYAWDHARYWIDAPSLSSVEDPVASVSGDRRATVSEWFERPVWRQTLPPPRAAESDQRVLVFTDPSAFGRVLIEQFTAAGQRVFAVHAGDEWCQDGDVFTVRASQAGDYERLLVAVSEAGALPSRVVHAWNVSSTPDAESLDTILERGFHSVHAFAQALANENPDAAFTFNAVTSDLQRIGGEAALNPAKALVLGPVRVMPQEYPNVRARAIDLTIPSAPKARGLMAARLVDEVLSDSTAATAALRGAERYEQHQEAIPLPQVASRLRQHGVYLVTGGLGGIGFVLADYLARTYHAKLVLIGRRATAEGTRAQRRALEAAGAEVEIIQADVTDERQVRTALERARDRFGDLHGVFHVAGTLNDSLLPFKTRADAEGVLAPKVQGTLALDRALGSTSLDVFVLFSSISAIAGLAGQADYTAANAFLDAFAHERSARDGSFVVSVNWSAWRDVGMAANLAATASGTGATIHPVLGRRLFTNRDAELFASDLSGESHWVIAEHRLRGGRTLMPGTGHLEIVRAAMHATPEPGTLEIRDLSFMSPLVVPDNTTREMRVHVSRAADGHRAIAIASASVDEAGQTTWREHVTATGQFVDAETPASLDLPSIARRCSVRTETFAADQESGNMDFGPRWKNLQSIRYGHGEALVTLELPAAFVDDLATYALHPALLDMATGRCEALFPAFNADSDFYVPLSYTRVRIFAPLTPRIVSHVRIAPSEFDPKELLVFNATIADEDGRVLVQVDEFVMTRVADRAQLRDEVSRGESRRSHARFEVPSSNAVLPPMVQRVESGIQSGEGMQAIEAILAGPNIAQVFATPEPLAALIADLRKPVVLAPPVSRPEATATPVPVPEVVSVLAEHDAIRECTVLPRTNRQGERKLVAYSVLKPGVSATVSDLRRFLKARLPESLLPSSFVDLEALPRDPSGTIDFASLPDPYAIADEYVAPRTDSERAIAEIWQDVLGVAKVSVRDNFFDAGGHSLLAVRVIVRIDKKVGVRLNQAIMVLQTLEQIAAECDRRIAAAASSGSAQRVAPGSAEVVVQSEAAPAATRSLGRKLWDTFRKE